MARLWNSHHIRPTKNQNCPHGRPLVMYSLPYLYGTSGYLRCVDLDRMEACQEECLFRNQVCDRDVEELCLIYMRENGWVIPQTLANALELYQHLRTKTRTYRPCVVKNIRTL